MKNKSWKEGITWTKGRWCEVKNPDGTTGQLYISSGIFLYYRFMGFEFYFGFRPTPPWCEGYGNEGIFPCVTKWLKRHGWGNFGIALRRIHD